MWTFQRYAKWLDSRTNWFIPGQNPEPPDTEPADAAGPRRVVAGAPSRQAGESRRQPQTPALPGAGGRLEIEAVEGGLGKYSQKFEMR